MNCPAAKAHNFDVYEDIISKFSFEYHTTTSTSEYVALTIFFKQ
jgi:hypothetical protein